MLLDTKVQKSSEEEGGREGIDGRTDADGLERASGRASERPRRDLVS